MSELSVVDGDPFKDMEEVASHMLKGASEYATARRTGLKVVQVKALWAEYKERLNADRYVTDAATDFLNLMIKQYDDLIERAHRNLEDLNGLPYDEKASAQINTTIKTIGDLQSKRVDMLQKAGLLDAHDLGDELAEREEREEVLINILRNDLCDNCRVVVAQKLQALTNQVEATVVYDEE